ncbi:MAG: sugar phosphate isomerase/epimerase [Gammaproteobacteria bacterium]
MKTLSRRSFLVRSGGVGVAAMAANCMSRRAYANPMGKPIGIQLYAVNAAIKENPAGTLKAIKEIGFGEVETAGFGKLTAKEFRKLLDDNGLACPSAHLQFDPANLGAAFEEAHALGAHYATSGNLRASLRPPLVNATRAMSLDEAKRSADAANKIGEKARQAGLQYAYHNHNGELDDQGGGATGYDLMLRETDPELVKFEIDCGWMVLGGRNPVDYFKKYPNRFPMIHVKDFLPPSKGADTGKEAEYPGAELGHGIIDYKPIFAVAEKAGLQHYFAEQEGPFVRMSQIEAARQAYAYLHALS